MKKQLLHYWLAMNQNAIQAAAAAGYSWLGSAAAHAADNSVPAMQFKTLLWVLAVAFISSVLFWLSKNPVPIADDSAPSMNAINPPAPASPAPAQPSKTTQ